MIHAIHFLNAALKDVPTSICDSQLESIEAVREIFTNGITIEYIPHKKINSTTHTKTRSAGTVPKINFQGWPRKPHGHNFQRYSTENSTHNSKKDKNNNQPSG